MFAFTFNLVLITGTTAFGDGVKDNDPNQVRPIPPPGLKLTDAARGDIEKKTKELRQSIISLKQSRTKVPDLDRRLRDAEVMAEAVERTLATNMIYKPGDLTAASRLLDEGFKRLEELKAGRPDWLFAKGPIARGYKSKIDGSIQPYGLVVPDSWTPDSLTRRRLDIWFHGRGETLSEVNFLSQRMSSKGEFAPVDAFVLHPYGRYNNANRFAGEVDTFEALEEICRDYRIDPDRIAVRGFSMGGAACWQFATHHPTLWAAAAPGAGFSETAEFLKYFQKETLDPLPWEPKLWRLYDSTTLAANLSMCPTVAYSGEIDIQRQASEIMATALKEQGIDLVHVIGPKTAHKYESVAKEAVARRIDSIVAKGRDTDPKTIRFATYSLRYNQAAWLRLDELKRHWDQPATIFARRSDSGIEITTANITGFSIHYDPGCCPFAIGSTPALIIDGSTLKPHSIPSDRGWTVRLHRDRYAWRLATNMDSEGTRKRPGLQGPIDDAFMDKFVFVRPTNQPLHAATGSWVTSEMQRAQRQWLLQFRGTATTVADNDVTDDLIQNSNLILWGDRKSNSVIARVLDKLPLTWNEQHLSVAGGTKLTSAGHMPILIYPNPLNPKRYVVLNSGFTFREYDQLNNARQTPKLPDFAIVDLSTPPGNRWPGKIIQAGFFDERWQP